MAGRPIHTLLTPGHHHHHPSQHFPKMPQPCRKHSLPSNLNHGTSLKRRARQFVDSILTCYSKKPKTYQTDVDADTASPLPFSVVADDDALAPLRHNHGQDRDLVSLKISLLGDTQIGKTSFLVTFLLFVGLLGVSVGFWFLSSFVSHLKVKYVGDEIDVERSEQGGLNLMDKTLMVRGARISYSIWKVGGN